jgi:hypothetical protein
MEALMEALQLRLLDAQAGRRIWMERSRANAKELNEAYDAMCEIAQMLDCAEDWLSIKAALAAWDRIDKSNDAFAKVGA